MPCFNISGGRAVDGGMSRLRARSDICRTKQFRTDALFVSPAAKNTGRNDPDTKNRHDITAVFFAFKNGQLTDSIMKSVTR